MPGSIVQFVEASGATAATSIAVAITGTAGNSYHVSAISDDATATCADTGSNSYGAEKGSVIEAGIPRRLHHFVCAITTGGSVTVTVTFGASVSNRQIVVTEITGVGAYDAQGTATDTGNNPTTAATATNSAQPAFGIAVCMDYQGGTPGVGTGYTSGGVIAGGGLLAGRIEYRSFSTVGSQSADFANAAFNRTATVFAIFLEDSPPSISAQPSDQTVNDGATATFSVTATGGTAPYTYQWQDDSSGSFANISGATSSSYGPTAAFSMQGRQYRCVVTGANSLSVTSNAATLRVAFNLAGTGQQAETSLGNGAFGAGAFESYIRGTAATGGSHATSGALSAQAATLAGTAAHLTLHTSTGALSAQAATISGAAQHQHAATGALSAQAATIAGSADHTAAGASHSTSGALAAQDATVSGSATHLTLHTTTGALAAQSATVSGSAAHQHAATGTLASQDATVAGTAAHLTLHTSTGALSSQAATLAGSAAHENAASGALSSQAATISGAATHTSVGTHDATGVLQAQDAQISGSALLEELPGAGFPGFEVDQAPKLWWKRKPSSPDEPAAEKPEQPKPKKPSKPSPEVKAQVRAAIAEAAKDQVKRGSVPKSARFAEVRSVLKPFGESADFNWPQLYERLYQQALTDALRQELELEATLLAQQQMRDEDDAIALLLLEA